MFKINGVKLEFASTWRVFISGSSSAGKTYFAKELLKRKFFEYNRIYYFHPDINEQSPNDWENHLDTPIFFQAGLPTSAELLELPKSSVIVLDDLFREASNSRDIDYLFRVLSGKRQLHVIIMTQRYFAEGHFSTSIRNSSNYHVLMNNADSRINHRAANTLGLKNDFLIGEKANITKLYPYYFIDQTNKARVTGLRLFTDILSQHIEVVYKSMLGYWISKADFTAKFQLVDSNTAIRNANSKQRQKTIESGTVDDTETKIENNQKSENPKIKEISGAFKRYLERRRIERAVKQSLQKHSRSTKL